MRLRKGTVLFSVLLLTVSVLIIRLLIWNTTSVTSNTSNNQLLLTSHPTTTPTVTNNNHLPSINSTTGPLNDKNSNKDIINTEGGSREEYLGTYTCTNDVVVPNNNNYIINYTHLGNVLTHMIPVRYLKNYKSYCWNGMKLKPQVPLPKLRTGYNTGGLLMEKGVVCLPYVFMGGFPKSGSGFVHNVLSIHPQVKTSEILEPHFWTTFPFTTNNYSDTVAVLSYLSNFKGGVECPQCVTIDASQSLIWKTLNANNVCSLPKLIKRILPSAKFIIMVRNPIEQAYSDFFAFGLKGCEKYLLPKAIATTKLFDIKITSEIKRFNECTDTHTPDYCVHYLLSSSPTAYKDCGTVRLASSLYYVHIKRWLQFFSKEQFLVLRLEDFVDNPYTSASRVWSFLGLTPLPHNEFAKKVMTISLPKVTEYNNRQMNGNTRQMLYDFFKPYNVKLAKLLNDESLMYI